MSDHLEDFIRDNRAEFDDKVPPADVWDNISSSMYGKTKTRWWNNVVIWRAAAMIFMAISIYLAVPKNTQSDKTALNEFRDVEAFYTREISAKVELIEDLSGGNLQDNFSQDFQKLDAMYQVLKEELKAHPSKKVKDALVLNLLVRINLLNQQLQRLEDDFEEEESPATSST